MRTGVSFNFADYNELLTTFAGLDSGKIVFDAKKLKSLWNFSVDDTYWDSDKRKFLVSQELYDSIFNGYAKNLVSLMAKINPTAISY